MILVLPEAGIFLSSERISLIGKGMTLYDGSWGGHEIERVNPINLGT